MRGFYPINKIGWSFSPADIMKKIKKALQGEEHMRDVIVHQKC